MRRASEITCERPSSRHSIVTVTLRTPELAKALNGAARTTHLLGWAVGTAALAAYAWKGGFGFTAHATIRFCIADAALFWATHTLARHWQNQTRTMSDRLVVELNDRQVTVSFQGASTIVPRGRDELRFSARPDMRGKREDRDERLVQQPVGYEFRDAWEIWCEAGVEVYPVCTVHHEDDARAIVRYLSEENLLVTRGDNASEYMPNRAEPA